MNTLSEHKTKIAVVIPCYKVTKHLIKLIDLIPSDVWHVYVIDDACPEKSGQFVNNHYSDNKKISILYHKKNRGVGGSVLTGYQQAIHDGAEIIIKIDGDGQMDPKLIPDFIAPILNGQADYTKGNRFFYLENLKKMPRIRIFGNMILSFMTKFSTGYYDIFDPTNGYTAISASIAKHLPFSKLSQKYFFETDMLFRLNTLQAVVIDIPMESKYGDETSNLKIRKILGEFLLKHLIILLKRIFYNYYLRGMSIASLELPLGIILFVFGVYFGLYHWIIGIQTNNLTPTGTVMVSVLPILIGLQLVLAFLNFDMNSSPKISKFKKING